MKTILRPALVLFAMLTLVCGVLYPYAITAIGQIAFARQAEGSLVFRKGQPIASTLIGQAFTSPNYFWGRPSAIDPMPNNPTASGGSNLGPSNPALINAVKARIAALKAVDPHNNALIPIDLVAASASGLDPEISVAAAYYQAARIARERLISVDEVRDIIDHNKTPPPYFGFFGEPRVNVLALNLALDQRRN